MSPLTDLLREVTTGRQRLLWTPCCEQAFRDLKSALISTTVFRGFDPLLRTAVYVDGSQSGVGAVLLQWEEGQQDPRPVCFLSHKLQGAQFQYDAHNVETFAIQIALVDGNVCSNVGFIQGKLSNIYYKCTDGWIKLVLRSTSFVVPLAQPLCRSRGVGKSVLLLDGETDISMG